MASTSASLARIHSSDERLACRPMQGLHDAMRLPRPVSWRRKRHAAASGELTALCASTLAHRKPPHRVRKKSGDYQPGGNAIQIMTTKVSKDLEFPVVALPGVGHMPAPGEDEREAARVFYVAATRATQRLVMGVGEDGGFGARLGT